MLFRDVTKRPPSSARPDTVSQQPTVDRSSTSPAAPSRVVPAPSTNSTKQTLTSTATVDTTSVRAQRTSYVFSSRGAVPISVVLDSYPSHRPPLGARKTELVQPRQSLMRYRLVLGADTVSLDTIPLQATRGGSETAPTLTYTGSIAGRVLQLAYAFASDSFLMRVNASVAGAPTSSALLIDLPRTLVSNEPDTLDDMGHLAVSYRSHGEINSVGFSKLDSAEIRREAGPLDWVATRNKYFLVAYRSTLKHPFSMLRVQGVPHTTKVASQVAATTALPLAADGTASFDVYAGPQDFERLQRLGGDLDQVNPYAGWLHGVVQPFATIVMRALLWMKRTTNLNYGWVLILFGVLIRLALWPLNQGAMRTSMKMQRLQPELQAIQKKYSDDPKRQQEAIMKVYKDHGMSPLSPLMGCLPMLLPMPILFALYFVFQNTIEFRGVSFLWLPDISLRDPYFITPLLMGVSMFVMSWIGLKGSPPNPQAKMMSYMMPVMLTVLFLNFASGLNLYYAVQNIAALPQQWLLARERSKSNPATVSSISGPSPAIKRRS
ncbi:MAG: YidC/Oxa1 family insertase periplasmic-domain containing protein [Gemmatimonadota bacterium]|nr:YidC/Oxa1 family insertase periplasmic-domain containing protein [Gemmatimonadota bacterium]